MGYCMNNDNRQEYQKIADELRQIRQILAHINHLDKKQCDFTQANAFVYQAKTKDFMAVTAVSFIPLELLYALDHQKNLLVNNTMYLANGLPTNNVLLWGARGTGKSS